MDARSARSWRGWGWGETQCTTLLSKIWCSYCRETLTEFLSRGRQRGLCKCQMLCWVIHHLLFLEAASYQATIPHILLPLLVSYMKDLEKDLLMIFAGVSFGTLEFSNFAEGQNQIIRYISKKYKMTSNPPRSEHQDFFSRSLLDCTVFSTQLARTSAIIYHIQPSHKLIIIHLQPPLHQAAESHKIIR